MVTGCGFIGYERVERSEPATPPLGRESGEVDADDLAPLQARLRVRLPGAFIEARHTDFAVRVPMIGESWLQASGPGNLEVRVDGALVPHEVTHQDRATGTAELWLLAPELFPGEDFEAEISIATGAAPSATDLQQQTRTLWQRAGFTEVMHLDEVASGEAGEYLETVSGSGLGRGDAGNTEALPARIERGPGFAQHLAGDGMHIRLASGSMTTQTGTLSHWVHRDDVPTAARILYYEAFGSDGDFDGFRTGTSAGYELHSGELLFTSGAFFLWQEQPSLADVAVGASTFPIETWVHLATTWDAADSAAFFVNGVETERRPMDTGTWGNYPEADFRALGAPRHFVARGDRAWQGAIDELRLSEVVRSAEWLALDARLGDDATSPIVVSLAP